ncbi:MAG: roadblock/LC7 domain-containing protein [Thermodesulfobacteriota bacterium]
MFNAILKDLTAKAGANGAIMLDHDGELVASYSGSTDLDMDLIGAHHGIILNIIRDASTRSAFKDVQSVSISTGKTRLAISTLKDGYYLVLATGKALPVGKALFESKKAVRRLEAEMG